MKIRRRAHTGFRHAPFFRRPRHDLIQLTWRALLGLALIIGAPGIACRTATAAAQFTITEHFGVSHPDQIIDFDFTDEVDWANDYMLGPDGSEVAYQVLSDGKIAVRTDLPANTTKTWTLMTGRPSAAPATGLTVTETDDYYEIVNGLTGVRVPKPTTDLRVPPAPVQGVRMRDGAWSATGPNYLVFPRSWVAYDEVNLEWPETGATATNMTFRFLEQGPLKVTVEVRP